MNPNAKQKQSKPRGDKDKLTVMGIAVETLPTSSTEEEECVYAFAVGDKKNEKIEVTIGRCKLNMIIDSGASTNIVDNQTWEWLKRNRVKCKSARSSRKLYTYASQVPLVVVGTFSCEVSVGRSSVNAEFCVILTKGESLLGKDTAMSLGVLKMGVDIASVSSSSKNIDETLQEEYPDIFKVVGKLKNRLVQLEIDPDIKPGAQPIRRTPFSLRSKVEEKIKVTSGLDIIESVDGPTPWVNPVVIVSKSQEDIRLCVDMGRAKEAILRDILSLRWMRSRKE